MCEKQRRDRSLETRLAKAKTKYEALASQYKALSERQKAREAKEDRKKRTSILIDLGLALIELYKAMGPEYRPNWFSQARTGLTGKALAKRDISLQWLERECVAYDEANKSAKSVS